MRVGRFTLHTIIFAWALIEGQLSPLPPQMTPTGVCGAMISNYHTTLYVRFVL